MLIREPIEPINLSGVLNYAYPVIDGVGSYIQAVNNGVDSNDAILQSLGSAAIGTLGGMAGGKLSERLLGERLHEGQAEILGNALGSVGGGVLGQMGGGFIADRLKPRMANVVQYNNNYG